MSENFVNEYNKEASVSSLSDTEEPREVIVKVKKAETLIPKPEQSSGTKEVVPYTFDPKCVLKSYENPGRSDATSKNDYRTAGLSYSLKGKNFSPSNNYGAKEAYQYRGSLTSRGETSYMTIIDGDPAEFRRTNEYKGYAKEFEKRYCNDQKEVEQVTRDLDAKTTKIDSFIQELRNTNLDMILYKNKLARELEDVKNDLREAYNNILVLMNDRSKMKDQFSIYKVKISKLKGFLKTYQEDVQA